MKPSSRYRSLGLLLLSVTLVLWITALLFLFRVVNIFDAVLMKFPGPTVIWAAMFFCPLVTAYLGIAMIRTRRTPRIGWLFAVGGGLLTFAFVVTIGVPILVAALTPGTPKNPSTPRPVKPLVGLPVFPGAEGFGTRTVAGRGGTVIPVTSPWYNTSPLKSSP